MPGTDLMVPGVQIAGVGDPDARDFVTWCEGQCVEAVPAEGVV